GSGQPRRRPAPRSWRSGQWRPRRSASGRGRSSVSAGEARDRIALGGAGVEPAAASPGLNPSLPQSGPDRAGALLLVVAVALLDSDGRVLITRRPEGKDYAGLWE